LYGENQGRNFDKAWGMAQHFMQNYAPNWTGQPQRV